MPSTANKGYEVQTTGTNEDTWGIVLNTQMIEYVDQNLGGLVTKTLSNSPVVLSAAESRASTVRLIGTLTGNVLVTTAAIGFTLVENATSGAFAVTFGNGVSTPVTIAQGTRAVVGTDATNGPRVFGDSAPEFPSGTVLPFYQQTAPTGWTKFTADTNIGVRITSSTDGGTIAGSANFTDIFTTRGITGTVGGTAITIAQMPVHDHDIDNASSGSGSNIVSRSDGVAPITNGSTTKTEGGGQSHDHSLSINNLNMSLRYVNMILASKN